MGFDEWLSDLKVDGPCLVLNFMCRTDELGNARRLRNHLAYQVC